MIKYKNQDINEINIGLADPVLEDKTVEITENGTTNVKAGPDADGLGNVTINANIAGGSVEVIDNLTSTSTTAALSANQGKVLNDIKADKTEIPDTSNFVTNEVLNGKGYLTEIPAEYVTDTELTQKGYLTEHQDISGKLDKSVYESEKADFATKAEIPTKTSQLTNDSGFLTEHQDISGKLDKSVYESEKTNFATKTELISKQDKLVSGTNIKTINDQSILGEGNIVIEGGSGGGVGKIDTTPGADYHGEIFNDYNTNQATGYASHAEGNQTVASGANSHAEGHKTNSIGICSHAEGNFTTASGECSHAEGVNTITNNDNEHAEGYYNKSNTGVVDGNTISSIGVGDYNMGNPIRKNAVEVLDNGLMFVHGVGDYDGTNPTETNSLQTIISKKQDTLVSGVNIATINNQDITLGGNIVIEGGSGGGVGQVDATPGADYHGEIFNDYTNNKAIGYYSHAEGLGTTASGDYSHAEGGGTTASGYVSHAEGGYTEATNNYSHAEGLGTTASSNYSHAEGYFTEASGNCSHAEGWKTAAIGTQSHAEGVYTTADNYAQHSQGQFNTLEQIPSPNSYGPTKIIFSIGNGTSDTERSDALKLLGNGNMWIAGTLNQGSADYAEMFEWLDSNPNAEDRVGYFVTLNGEKIVKATSKDDYILGIVSAAPAVIGDNPNLWHGQYINDEWDRPIYEDVEVKYVMPEINENGKRVEVEKTRIDHIRKINPDWDASTPYKDRTERKEWSAIGLVGKLLVRQDGTLTAGSYCKPNDEGIATKSDTGYYVMRVNNKNQALVLFK